MAQVTHPAAVSKVSPDPRGPSLPSCETTAEASNDRRRTVRKIDEAQISRIMRSHKLPHPDAEQPAHWSDGLWSIVGAVAFAILFVNGLAFAIDLAVHWL